MGKISTEKKTYEFPSTHPLGTFLFWAKPCMHWDCGFLGVPLQTPLSRYIGRIIWGLLQSPFVVFFFISPIHYFFFVLYSMARLTKKRREKNTYRRNQKWKRRSHNRYYRNTKNHKRKLLTTICQQIRQLEDMDNFLETYSLPKTESRRNGSTEQNNH